jgi:hypothetical protein
VWDHRRFGIPFPTLWWAFPFAFLLGGAFRTEYSIFIRNPQADASLHRIYRLTPRAEALSLGLHAIVCD